MKHLVSALAVVAWTAMSAAASPLSLDYRATDTTCVDASSFANDVTAKLGFAPWSAAASSKIRVRVERDGDHFTGSLLYGDGTSKIVDGGTCQQVTSTLALTVAGALASGPAITAPAAPVPAPDDGRVAVTFAAVDGRRVDISLQSGGGFGHSSSGATVVATFWDKLCTSPCTARVPAGRNQFLFTEPESQSIGGGSLVLDAPTTVTLRHHSRSGARRGWFFTGLAITAASVVGGYALGGADGVLVGSLGGGVGLSAMMVPLLINDSFTATRSP